MILKSKSIKIALLAIWCFSLLTSVSVAAISPEERKKIENAIPEKAPAVPKRPRKLLVFNLDIWDGAVRKGHTSIPYGNLALEMMGRKTKAYETVISNDIAMFRAENLRQFDAICFNNTTGVLFEDPELKKSLLEFVSNGKGFVGIHAAGATFVQWPKYDQWPEFGEMLGGYENGGHPWKSNEWITIKLDDPEHPLNAAFKGKGFRVSDEVFQFQKPYSRDKLRILLSIDMTKTEIISGRYILPERQDHDFAISWIRSYGKGRVFYSTLGHNSHIFWNPSILQHYLAGIQFALGDLASDTTPSNKLAEQYKFEPTSESLRNYKVPQWYEDAKFGIYFHWAPFSVAAYKTEWYPHWMYSPSRIKNRRNFQDIPKHHIETWGPLDKFGYKDFIPLFKAEKWNPDEWARLFKEAGAKYVASAAVHHDGFAMWDSKYIPYNSKAMGPKRDVVGDFITAARKVGLKAGLSTHYGRHWAYYTFRPQYDNWDPKYEGLYGYKRADNDPPRTEDEQHWENVLTELIDNYRPDYIFVDGGIGDGKRKFKKPYFRQPFYNVLAHYYNSAQQWGKGVVITYKREFLETDQAVENFERAGLDNIRLSSKWQTDDKISVNGWCYVENTDFWPVDYLIGALVDIVSKNGNLLLNVGPKPDGTLREVEVRTLKEIGRWLKVNGDAIYGTRPWRQFGEGSMVKISDDGKQGKQKMGPDCVRFTVKNGILYAVCFGWPNSGKFTIKSLSSKHPVSKDGIKSISMLGSNESIQWNETENGLEVTFPKEKPCDYAYVLRIVPKSDL